MGWEVLVGVLIDGFVVILGRRDHSLVMLWVDDAVLFKQVLGVVALLASDNTQTLRHLDEVEGVYLVKQRLNPISLEHINQPTFPMVHPFSYLNEKSGHLHELDLFKLKSLE